MADLGLLGLAKSAAANTPTAPLALGGRSITEGLPTVTPSTAEMNGAGCPAQAHADGDLFVGGNRQPARRGLGIKSLRSPSFFPAYFRLSPPAPVRRHPSYSGARPNAHPSREARHFYRGHRQ